MVVTRLRDEAARAPVEERATARHVAGTGRGVLDWGGSLQGVVPPGGSVEHGPDGQLDPARARRHEHIFRDLAEVEALARQVDGARTWAAGRVDEASAHELGAEGLAKQHNFRSPAALTAAVAGVSERTARQRIRLAKLTPTGTTLLEEVTPGAFPAVATALHQGTLGAESAEVIVTGLSRVIRRIGSSERTEAAERELIALATADSAGLRHTAEDVAHLTEHVAELLDPDGAAPDEGERCTKRFLRLTPLSDGMTKLSGLLDPESAAVLSAFVIPTERERAQEWVEHGRAPTPDGPGAGSGFLDPEPSARSAARCEPVIEGQYADRVQDPAPDNRTRAQRTLDRLIDGVRAHLRTRNAGLTTGTSTLVSIHVSAEALQDGNGPAWTDGLFAPLSAGTALRELCDAHHVIPWNQHHLHGPTDVGNGVLLCRFHHRRIHANMQGEQPPGDRWTIKMIRELPHLIPPQHLDWNRTPRPLGRRRLRRTTPARAPSHTRSPGPG